MHMLLILLALCLRRPNGISHLFSIVYAFAGNGCLPRIVVGHGGWWTDSRLTPRQWLHRYTACLPDSHPPATKCDHGAICAPPPYPTTLFSAAHCVPPP